VEEKKPGVSRRGVEKIDKREQNSLFPGTRETESSCCARENQPPSIEKWGKDENSWMLVGRSLGTRRSQTALGKAGVPRGAARSIRDGELHNGWA